MVPFRNLEIPTYLLFTKYQTFNIELRVSDNPANELRHASINAWVVRIGAFVSPWGYSNYDIAGVS